MKKLRNLILGGLALILSLTSGCGKVMPDIEDENPKRVTTTEDPQKSAIVYGTPVSVASNVMGSRYFPFETGYFVVELDTDGDKISDVSTFYIGKGRGVGLKVTRDEAFIKQAIKNKSRIALHGNYNSNEHNDFEITGPVRP